jgi:hypothetical protein
MRVYVRFIVVGFVGVVIVVIAAVLVHFAAGWHSCQDNFDVKL